MEFDGHEDQEISIRALSLPSDKRHSTLAPTPAAVSHAGTIHLVKGAGEWTMKTADEFDLAAQTGMGAKFSSSSSRSAARRK